MSDQQGGFPAQLAARMIAPTLTLGTQHKAHRGGRESDNIHPMTAAVRNENLSLWTAADQQLFMANFLAVHDVFTASNVAKRPTVPETVSHVCLHPDFISVMNRVSNRRLTHVTSNVHTTLSTNIILPISIPDLCVRNLSGHHVLIDVPLRHLKACIKQIKQAVQKNVGPMLSAIFLVPKGNFFSKSVIGLRLLGEYSPQIVYSKFSNENVHLPSCVEAYLCGPDNYLPPPPVCTMASLNTGALTMRFDALLSHAGRTPTVQVNVLLDSGATHCFIPASVTKHLGITILPSSFLSTGLGNGNDCQVLGECSISLEIQGVRDTIKCLVLADFMTGIDLVLGNNWHKANNAIVNWKDEFVSITSGNRQFKLFAITSPCWRRDILSALNDKALTSGQTKRWTQAGARSFSMFVGVNNSLISPHLSSFSGLAAATLPPINPLELEGLPGPPISPPIPILHPPGVQFILDKYADIFGELPIGLPPVRGEGHVITLIEGAKPSFRPNFRMSPAELAETNSQVKILLAQGFIEQSQSPYAAPITFVTKKDGG